MAGTVCRGDGQRRGEGVEKGTFKPSDRKERLKKHADGPGEGECKDPEEREPGSFRRRCG